MFRYLFKDVWDVILSAANPDKIEMGWWGILLPDALFAEFTLSSTEGLLSMTGQSVPYLCVRRTVVACGHQVCRKRNQYFGTARQP